MDSQVVSVTEYEELKRKYDFWNTMPYLPLYWTAITTTVSVVLFFTGHALLGALFLVAAACCFAGLCGAVGQWEKFKEALENVTPEILPEVRITQENGVTIGLYEEDTCLAKQSFSGDDSETIQAAIEYREELNIRCEEMIQERRLARLIPTEEEQNRNLYELLTSK